MTCNDCLHIDACADPQGYTRFLGPELGCGDVEDRCKFFIDRNAVIKLPCKLGETVYEIVQYSYPTNKPCYKRIGGNKLVVEAVKKHRYFKIKKTSFHIRHLDMLGDTVFLYPEEAEKQLKELVER